MKTKRHAALRRIVFIEAKLFTINYIEIWNLLAVSGADERLAVNPQDFRNSVQNKSQLLRCFLRRRGSVRDRPNQTEPTLPFRKYEPYRFYV